MLSGKNIILGISGGIAAYKAPFLVRLLVKEGANVMCAVTDNALQFVTTTTLETVSGNRVYSKLFDRDNPHSTEHISLKDWGDAMIVAPATANIIGKMACGIGDDALSTLLLSYHKPLLVCPAMNTQMLESPALQRNIAQLRNDGINFVDSVCGELACGASGNGRMAEPETIVEELICLLCNEPKQMAGQKVLVTAGPTYEKIDAVRFIGNFSTGKMGFAIAEELAQRGAEVFLVAGPTHLTAQHSSIKRIDVVSATEMFNAATQLFPSCNAAILSAAVADFRPETTCETKIKKNDSTSGMTVNLVQNPDILATLGKTKRPDQILVGFALETDNETDNAKKKLEKKNLDFIVLNSLRDSGAGFGHDTNKITILHRNGEIEQGSLKSKKEVAGDVVNALMKEINK